MLLHRTDDAPPALETVEVASLTSFPAHDLGAGKGWAHRLLLAEPSGWVATGIRSFHLPEIRSRHLPFATGPLFHSIPAAG